MRLPDFTEKAIPQHEATIARFTSKLGDDHLSTLVAMNNLAKAYQLGGRVHDSIELYEKTLAKLRTKLSDDHPTTLAAMNGLAGSYRLAGKLDRAISLLEATLEGRRVKLGPDHPETLVTSFDLADAYMAAGEPGKADPAGPSLSGKDRGARRSPPRQGSRAHPQGGEAAGKRVASSGATVTGADGRLPDVRAERLKSVSPKDAMPTKL